MEFAEPIANPLQMKVRRGKKPATKTELRRLMASMVQLAQFFDLGKPEKAAPQVIKCYFDDVLIEVTGESKVEEVLVKYLQDHVQMHTTGK